MKSRLALAWMFVTACGFESPPIGARPDAPGVPTDACTSFSAQLDTCQLPSPFALTLSGTLTFDTDTGVLKDSSDIVTPVVSFPIATLGGEVRALVATSVLLMPGTSLRAQGPRGFAIVATGAITLQANAVIDVSQGGAGHRTDCGPAAAASGMPDNDGGAGGGGGGFGAAGGDGGNGDGDGIQSMGGKGGDAAASAPAGPLGGCPGASGGRGDTAANDGGAGGAGGGAAYLVSAASIVIGAGAGIQAGGAGGGGGERESNNGDAGGGGGGSGGSIFLEAPTIRSGGILAANGGGGGSGSGGTVAGSPGSAGLLGLAEAAGGQNPNSGADGGGGGHRARPAGARPARVENGGGGGGGGSVGFIRVRSADAQLGDNASPAAVVAP